MARTILAQVRVESIRDADEGAIVKVVGEVVVCERTLVSPLSQRECVYYDARATAPAVKTVRAVRVHARDAVDFFVEDESGRARVRVGGDMQVVVVRDVDRKVGFFGYRGLRRFLREHGAGDVRVREIKEGSLEPGERVAVVGRASWVARDPALVPTTYRERPQILVLSAPESQPLIVSDDPTTF